MKYFILLACLVFYHIGNADVLDDYSQSLVESASYQIYKIDQSTAPLPSPTFSFETSTTASKNRGSAFFRSLLLPGWGQHYAEAHTKRNVFFGIEVGLWLTYFGFTQYANWREEDYKTYAATHAGADLDGKNNRFFINVGNFDSVYEYNQYRLKQRNFADYYVDKDTYFWQWQSPGHRAHFDQLRISADTADNRAVFTLGAIVANHLFSAIDAILSVNAYEKRRVSRIDWDVRFGDGHYQPLVNCSLAAHF